MSRQPKHLSLNKSSKYSRPLTREKIAAAAIDIVRCEGQSALSMRKIAGLFEVDVAALYRHFKNKDELLAKIGQLASEMVDLEPPTGGAWEERLLDLAKKIRDRIGQHPELGIYGGDSAWATPFFARANGLIAELFCEAGLEGKELVFATQTLLHLITSITQSEVMASDTPTAMNRSFAELIHAQLSQEVRKAWPATTARTDWSIDFDALFDFALRSTLRSLLPETNRSR
ncbi:MAG: TetR/AcrR family transcriptional regulator [Myxococcota bacterium]